jgi:uncharacterized protein (DUF934 family)
MKTSMKPIKFIDPLYPQVWHAVASDDVDAANLAPQGYQVLTIAQWQGVRGRWPLGMPVGVKVPNDSDIELLADDLHRIGLLVLSFPKWTDGRAYSQARLLRSRYRFTGEVRATGEVLVDMLPLLERTGFDSLVMRAGQDRAAAERALRFFPGHYQGDTREVRPVFVRQAA